MSHVAPVDPTQMNLTSFRKHKRKRVLAVCNIDSMAAILLRPWLEALRSAGFEVEVACAPGAHAEALGDLGFRFHPLSIQRRFNPLRNLKPILQAWRLIRRGNYDIVNTHSPIGAAVGRVAAWLASTPRVVYTVHGFYFHDDMPPWQRLPLTAIEWLLGRITDQFMFVSDEDRQTAIRLRIAPNANGAATIYNGVNSIRFAPSSQPREQIRRIHGLPPDRPVVGIVGRIVREKGYDEFLDMAIRLVAQNRKATFLVVGDSLPSDRDQYAGKFKQRVTAAGLQEHFVFSGFTARVAELLQAMDIFVLPSYREGFPRSILEAMATSLPVVTTNIRGCREAVVDGSTGLIVPPRDAGALADAIASLLDNPSLAFTLGQAGRERASTLFAEGAVQKRFVTLMSGH